MRDFWDRLPFAARLLTTASVALVVAGSAMLGVSARQEARDARADLAATLAQELDTLPHALAEIVVIGDFSTLQQTLDRFVARPLIAHIEYHDTRGTVLSSRDTDRSAPAPAWFLALFGYAPTSGSAPVMVGGRAYGELSLTLSPHQPAVRAWQRLQHHLAILFLAIALDFAGIWLVLHFGLRPLKRLDRAVDALAEGRLETRIDPFGSPEFRHLIVRFNHMAATLESAQDDLRQFALAAEAANVAKSRFLATMSHEIRTPMNGILGMAQLLLDAAMTEAERRDCARTILNSGQTLLTLLNDILDLSKVEAGKLSLEMSVVDPRQILHETQALFVDNAKAKGLRLDVSWSGLAAARYRGDPHRLRQMLSNLVNNAIKFTSQGEVLVTASEFKEEGALSLLEFAVTDTGVGIPPEKLALLFKPFSQADNSISRQFGGSGLGLSIVSSLAKLMGGEVGVGSEPGKGSRFWFRVRAERVAENEESRQQVRADSRTAANEWVASLHGRVLIVEDNPTNQLVLNALLPKSGMQTLLAENGQEAIECIIDRGESVDAILMDLQMPVMDGYEATRRIRAWEKANGRPAIPIIALTADAFPEDREHCLRMGMDDFVAKPIVLERLLQALGRWLAVVPSQTDRRPPLADVRELDVSRFLALSDTLLPMLAQGKFDAIDRFGDLEKLAAGSPQEEALRPIREMLDTFCFNEAQAALVTLCNTLKSRP